MRIALIGGGEIARLFLESLARGELGEGEIVAIAGRSSASRGKALATQFGAPFVIGAEALVAARPDVVLEAASHEAVREYGLRILEQGVSFIVLSGGALCDERLRVSLESAAQASNAMLYVPSGGIGGLDALKAACIAGVEAVEIVVAKPPQAWRDIAYVQQLGIALDRLEGPIVLFEGTAREGVPHFPANVNIAAVLSMAGVGYDHTRLKAVADPALRFNTHTIAVRGKSGTISVRFESVPLPGNLKTALLAACSALAAFKQFNSRVRYGT